MANWLQERLAKTILMQKTKLTLPLQKGGLL